jgi:hypothetical protein
MIKPRFTPASLQKDFERRLKQMDQAILARLQYIGENFVNNARSNGAYLDQTGNLRSSIGYIVQKDGKRIYSSGFERLKNGVLGKERGQAFMNEIRSKFQNGYVLIVVAGMDYAAAVESMGKDVLTASSIIAKADLKRAFKQYKG